MKTPTIVLYNIILAMTVSACSTTIPVTDTTPPRFSFQIRGDDFSRTFDQDTDFSSFQLNLRNNAVYNFILTGADDGGVSLIRWQFANNYFELLEPVNSPWAVRDITEFTRNVDYTGDSSAPLTANVLEGRFRVNGRALSETFKFWVRDFGGQTGSVNTFSEELNILIDDHETEIIDF